MEGIVLKKIKELESAHRRLTATINGLKILNSPEDYEKKSKYQDDLIDTLTKLEVLYQVKIEYNDVRIEKITNLSLN